MLAQRDSGPGRRPAQSCKPKIRNTVAERVQYERGGNDWIVTEVMSPDGRHVRQAPGWRNKLSYVFPHPGWRHDASGEDMAQPNFAEGTL